jgi:hypothetical protein
MDFYVFADAVCRICRRGDRGKVFFLVSLDETKIMKSISNGAFYPNPNINFLFYLYS